MKIGIVTFPKAINYGTALQAAALRKYLLSCKPDCEVAFLNHKCKEIESSNKIFDFACIGSPKYIATHLVNMPVAIRRNRAFRKFWNKTMTFTDAKPNEMDVVVAGSDQIWNHNLTGFDRFYYLDFKKSNTKKISYAGSFGLSELGYDIKDILSEYFKDFDYISVREQRAAEMIEEMTSCRPELVVDPTMLLTSDDWIELSDKSYKKEHYIFVYTVFNSNELWDFAYKLSEKTGLPIRTVSYSVFHRHKAEYDYVAGPDRWLSSLINADYVITNSFHGVALSLNLSKQFFYELPPRSSGVGSRISNIVKRYNLTKRNIHHPYDDEVIDYAPIQTAMAKDRESSEKFVKQAIFGQTVNE